MEKNSRPAGLGRDEISTPQVQRSEQDENARQDIESHDGIFPENRTDEAERLGRPDELDPDQDEPRNPVHRADPNAGLTTAALAGTAPTPEQSRVATQSIGQGTGARDDHPAPLLPDNAANELRQQWSAIQTGFVDEPRRAVEEADNLVAVTMKKLAETFANERSSLERQWDKGDEISTEDLRLALQRYRSFFQRLLSI